MWLSHNPHFPLGFVLQDSVCAKDPITHMDLFYRELRDGELCPCLSFQNQLVSEVSLDS